MTAFVAGVITLFICTAIFYIVLFSFIYYWHLIKVTYIMVPLIWTFEFFLMGFFVVAAISIIIDYLPTLII